MRSVLIYGSGRVGRSAGLLLALQGWHVIYYDVNPKTAKAAAEDTRHAAACANTGGWADWTSEPLDVDVVVVTASKPRRGERGPRMTMLEANLPIALEVSEKVYHVAPRAWYVVVTNPVDVIATIIAQLTKSPKVLSTGTYIDSARLRCYLAQKLGKPLHNVWGLVGGIHGDDPVILWSTVRVEGARLEPTPDLEKEALEYIKESPEEIVEAIGMTVSGAGTMVAAVVEKLYQPHMELTALAPCRDGVCIGQPCLVGAGAIEPQPWILEERERREIEERARIVAEKAREALEKARLA